MRRIDVLLAELERERAFGINPGASRLWRFAPPRLRLEVANGYISREDFWNRLRRWLEHEARAA